MANCGLCGGFTFSGPLCSLCANTLAGSGQTLSCGSGTVTVTNIFAIPAGAARDAAWERIGDA